MGTRQGNIIDGFNLLAPAYDASADIFTLGLHRIIRQQFCKQVLKKIPRNSRLLDIGTGTGDMVFRLLERRPDLTIHGIDLSSGMLQIAQTKLNKKTLLPQNKIHLQLADALHLPFEPNTFQAVFACWSLRNIRPLQAALREAQRVLKPGGHIFVLEHGLPEIPKVRAFLNKYSQALPLLEKVSHSKIMYPMHTTSAEGFAAGKHFVAELFEAGFVKAQYTPLCGGLVCVYEATTPQPLHP